MVGTSNTAKLFAVGALCLLAFAAIPGAHARLGGTASPARKLAGKRCCNAAGEAACIAACAAAPLGLPVCLSDACYGPNGCDFSPECGK